MTARPDTQADLHSATRRGDWPRTFRPPATGQRSMDRPERSNWRTTAYLSAQIADPEVAHAVPVGLKDRCSRSCSRSAVGREDRRGEWLARARAGSHLPIRCVAGVLGARLKAHDVITPTLEWRMIEVIQADITTLSVDAIVNAANEALRGGGGVDGAIHRAAGPELLEECRRYPGCPVGEAVLTRGYRLPARFVIHTVGPVWRGGGEGEVALLRRAYQSVFRLAREQGTIRTLAFPAISTGVYGFPKQPAAEIALETMQTHVPDFERIVACLFDAESVAIYRSILQRGTTQ